MDKVIFVDIINEIKELEFESIEVIQKLGLYYQEWCNWNQYYDFHFMILDVQKAPFWADEVIVIHNIYKENGIKYSIEDGEKFINNVASLLEDWIESFRICNENLEWFNEFWETKVEELSSISP